VVLPKLRRRDVLNQGQAHRRVPVLLEDGLAPDPRANRHVRGVGRMRNAPLIYVFIVGLLYGFIIGSLLTARALGW